ncbi:MAG: hypothetical protein L6Q37_03380 [Bdellovibrionaceae bacterium]|nr:hypothetical protein [Pseudobdellovibrionaceae bacterium]NUM58147.1 hypothetical protein [Pseudobdellovibrionaceae bacterium]
MKKTPKETKFYTEKSPLKKAWEGLWHKPTTTSADVIKLNEKFLSDFYQKTNNISPKERSSKSE